MRIQENKPPRTFEAGYENKVTISDCGKVSLEADEQVTFTTPAGGEYDVARKDWGFYATPSLNARLARFGLRPVLVRNRDDRFFVLLVEKGQEASFGAYATGEPLTTVCWLDDLASLKKIEGIFGAVACPVCGSGRAREAHVYRERPEGEVAFGVFPEEAYLRRYFRCGACDHHYTDFRFPEKALYEGNYVQATYNGLEGIRKTFAKIRALPPGKSDNAGRVRYIRAFLEAQGLLATKETRVLDVGSGLGVFPFAMKEAGFSCTALDPDAIASEHMRGDLGLEVITGDFFGVSPAQPFQAVTFNKVLEHVPDPVAMLKRAKDFLAPGGFVYIELPDAEAAGRDSYLREEFFIDHLHVFSFASMALLAERAGFEMATMERLREPSGKYTLRGFAAPLAGGPA